MKKAADELKINYSTAKTIVQKFRNEGKITRNLQRKVITKKSINHERSIAKVLSIAEVNRITEAILNEEFDRNYESDTVSKSPYFIHQRVNSKTMTAEKKNLEEYEEEIGPMVGQISCGIMTNTGKKDIFIVQCDSDEEHKIMSSYGIKPESNPTIKKNNVEKSLSIETTPISPENELSAYEKSLSPFPSPIHYYNTENFCELQPVHEFDMNQRDLFLPEIQTIFPNETYHNFIEQYEDDLFNTANIKSVYTRIC